VSTLEVRVNAVRWQEVPSLYGLQARSQSYMLRRDEAGRTAVIFGDGLTGARLPSGQENVVATYRSGIGLAGNVAAGTLSLMPARPAGLRTVTNPLAASGGASPETLEAARDRVPRTVLTLERIVSQQDYEDFARSFAGVGKVQATTMWTGATRLIHLTIADAAGQSLAPNAALVTSLAQAIRTVGNPLQRVVIQSYTPRYFRLEAAVVVDPRYLATAVMADVQAALTAAFHFEQRAFGQGVAASEVITIVQGVPGVVAVDLDRLFFQEDPPALQPTLLARAAYLTRDTAETLTPHPAEFLLLDPDHGMQITARSS
jgi:predicted phage baseplate assembly protein